MQRYSCRFAPPLSRVQTSHHFFTLSDGPSFPPSMSILLQYPFKRLFAAHLCVLMIGCCANVLEWFRNYNDFFLCLWIPFYTSERLDPTSSWNYRNHSIVHRSYYSNIFIFRNTWFKWTPTLLTHTFRICKRSPLSIRSFRMVSAAP